MLFKIALICLTLSFTKNALAAGDYRWEYSLETNCIDTCSGLDEFTEVVSTYKGDTQVCGKKSLFGMAFKPGYKVIGEEGCFVANLRNRVFQCLCALPDNKIEWRDHDQENGNCQRTCSQWGQTPVYGDNSSFPVCSTIIHDQEYSGHIATIKRYEHVNAKSYCLAGNYTSTIAQCLCH
ncbi:MAG: hypothetical protein HRU09_18865 [Oligoflexales bacterium]|nr:hypothetical protein [Oligoflexales bacterium]